MKLIRKIIKSIFLFILLFYIGKKDCFAQVGIGTTAPKGVLDLTSTNDGFIIPRIALSATNVTTIITPTISELVYNTFTSAAGPNQVVPGFYYWNGTIWVLISTSTIKDWSIAGNSGTDMTTNFIGNTDDKSLQFRVNNQISGMISNSTGSSTLFGFNAGLVNTASNTTAFGHRALDSNTTGANNVAIGTDTLGANISGSDNVAIGNNALLLNTASDQIAIGSNALDATTSGQQNIAIGKDALGANSTGSTNVAIGLSSGSIITSGSNNTFLGTNANASANYSNCTAIGSNTTVNASNKVRIGSPSVTSYEVGVAWTVASDKNLKSNIKYDVPGLHFVNKLQPATYTYKAHGKNGIRYTGLLAQDVEDVLQKMGITSSIVDKPNPDGTGSWGIRYAELTLPLINSVKELYDENEQLKAEIFKLKNKVNEFEHQIKEIKVLLQNR